MDAPFSSRGSWQLRLVFFQQSGAMQSVLSEMQGHLREMKNNAMEISSEVLASTFRSLKIDENRRIARYVAGPQSAGVPQ